MLDPARFGRRSTGSRSPTTSSTRWAAAATATSARATARRRQLRGRRGSGGVAQIVYLGGLGEPGSRAPAQPPRDRRACSRRAGVAADLLPRRGGDRRGQRVVSRVYYLVKRLPVMVDARAGRVRTQPIAIGDVVAFLARRRRSRRRAARDRDRRPRGHHLRRDDGRGGAGAWPAAAAADRGAAADAAALLALDRARDAGRHRGRTAPGRGARDETIVPDPSGMARFDVEPTPLDRAMREAVEEDRLRLGPVGGPRARRLVGERRRSLLLSVPVSWSS